MIVDQLGHSRVSMTQDVYLGRRVVNAGNLAALESYAPVTSTSGPRSREAFVPSRPDPGFRSSVHKT